MILPELAYNLKEFNLDSLLIVGNVVLLLLLFLYALYLYLTERKLKKKYSVFDTAADDIIEDANKKALQILTRSQFLSSSLRNELHENFDIILTHLKNENIQLYRNIETDYKKRSEDFIQKVQSEEERNLDKIATEISTEAKNTRQNFEEMLKKEYQKSYDELEAFKIQKKADITAKYTNKVDAIVKEYLPGYIPVEEQQKLVIEAVEKAFRETNE